MQIQVEEMSIAKGSIVTQHNEQGERGFKKYPFNKNSEWHLRSGPNIDLLKYSKKKINILKLVAKDRLCKFFLHLNKGMRCVKPCITSIKSVFLFAPFLFSHKVQRDFLVSAIDFSLQEFP